MCFRPAAANVDAAKCPQCGTEYTPDQETCPQCGAVLPKAPGASRNNSIPSVPKIPGVPGIPGVPKAPGAPKAPTK